MLPLPAGREASSGGGVSRYGRHRPERTLLYQLVQECYPAFKARLAAQGNAFPGYVEQEFEDTSSAGGLSTGFCGFAAISAMRNISSPSNASSAASAPVAGHGAWPNR